MVGMIGRRYIRLAPNKPQQVSEAVLPEPPENMFNRPHLTIGCEGALRTPDINDPALRTLPLDIRPALSLSPSNGQDH